MSSFHYTVTGRVNYVFLDTSGDQYAQQTRYGQAGYGSDQQRSDDFGQGRDDWGQGRAGAGRTSDPDPSSTSAQYGGSVTGGYSDPSTTQSWKGQRSDDDTTGTGGGKPTTTSKVKGTSLLPQWGVGAL